MAATLYLSTSFDVDEVSGEALSVAVTDTGGSDTITIASGLLTHDDISSVDSDYSTLSSTLQTALNASGTLNGTYTVTWNGATGYTVACTETFSLTFSGDAAVSLRRALGLTGNKSSASSYASDTRPWYMVHPVIGGRTSYRPTFEVPDVVAEAVADDGTAAFIAKVTADKLAEWTHVAELEVSPVSFEDPGTPIFADDADAGTSADDVSFSWEQMFEHLRSHEHRLIVRDTGASTTEVYTVRADGMFFNPTRWSGADFPLWQIPMRCRKIGAV